MTVHCYGHGVYKVILGTLTMKSNITVSQLLLALLKLLISSYQPDMVTCNLNNAF